MISIQTEMNGNFQANMQISQMVKMPILTYHSIDKSNSVISTAPEVFHKQIKFLAEMGYNAVSLNNFLDLLLEKKPVAPKTVALTFDDGFQNFYTAAFPVLERYNFKATVFLVTDYCGKRNEWEIDTPGIPLNKILSWEEIKRLNAHGIEFGAHTLTHPDLTNIPVKQAEREIVGSKAAIEEHLGVEVKTFAYPYGTYNSRVRKIAEENFRAACGVRMGRVRPTSDPFALDRIDSFYLSSDYMFNWIIMGSSDWYLRLRQILRNVKNNLSKH